MREIVCIASSIGGPIDQQTLIAMTQAISHRGPDGEGYYLQEGIGLGHRRLSIVDLELGAQPIYNEAEDPLCRITSAFFRTLYNYNCSLSEMT